MSILLVRYREWFFQINSIGSLRAIMIAEPGPADKLRVNESKGIWPTKKKKAFPVSARKAF
jgi:hypothetical protein